MQMSFGKLILSALSVLISSILLENLFDRFRYDQSRVVIDLDSYVDSAWATECKEYILEYLTEWENETFTPDVAICKGTCALAEPTSSSPVSLNLASNCETFPLILLCENVENNNNDIPKNRTVSERTLPCYLELKISKIPNAGRGIFTRILLRKGTIFGPYGGVIKSAYGEEGDDARQGGYAWRVNRYTENDEEDDFYIDGISETNSNWLRFVNAARYEEEQNMYVLIFNETVYYMIYKDVPANEELLTWYGRNYARWLGIEVLKGAGHDWESDFAPRKKIVICDSCEQSRASLNLTSSDLLDDEEEQEESAQTQRLTEDSKDHQDIVQPST